MEVRVPNSRGRTRAWGPYPQLKGPHQSVRVYISNVRGHAEAWKSGPPTQKGPTRAWESAPPTKEGGPNNGGLYPEREGPRQSVGVHIPNWTGHTKAPHQNVVVRIPNSRGHPEAWQGVSPT